MSKGWDNNMLKKLKTLIGKGLSASEIGKRLEVSKNAVIGKLNRLGWNVKAAEPKSVKTASKPKKDAKASAKTGAKKTTVKTANKKTVKKESVKTKKELVIKATKKPVVATKPAKSKTTVADKKVEKPVIKTASKKTKKDLALHELLIQHALQMANLKPNQCRWPIGDPDSENFHFCGETVFSGKPYCYEHCRQAYQFTPPKKK